MLRSFGQSNPAFSTIGLHGPTIYDVLADNPGNGSVVVNATRYSYKCGAPPPPDPQVSVNEGPNMNTTQMCWGDCGDSTSAQLMLPRMLGG